MYSLSDEPLDYYHKVICGCKRKFLPEEMYICFHCNKLLCKYCVSVEYEFFQCKNNCKRNQYLNSNQIKEKKKSCDMCLECPICFTALTKQKINNLFLYRCSYCYWDTSAVKFAKEKEEELDLLVGQFQEKYNEGLLKNMYNYALKKLKENMNIKEENDLT